MTIHLSPPKKCDTCPNPITDGFSDASVPAANGSWGNLCPPCAVIHKVRYGTGLGQRYELRDDGKYHKVEG